MAGCGPASKIRRLDTEVFSRVPGAGVDNVKNLVDWPAYATGGLQDAALAAGHPPSHLAEHFAGRKTIYVSSSCSGMGTFEHCMKRLAAACAGAVENTGVKFWSASECDKAVRDMLLQSSGCPEHVFGDLTERVDSKVLARMKHAVGCLQQRAHELAATKQTPAQKKVELGKLNVRCMQKLLELAMEAVAADRGGASRCCYCYVHDQLCPLLPPGLDEDADSLLPKAGGNTCVSFSPQGKQAKWLHDSAVVAAVWLAWCAGHCDMVMQECSYFRGHANSVSPKDLGIPMNRPRNFSCTDRLRRLSMVTSLTSSLFLQLCGSELRCNGHDFFIFAEDAAHEYLQATTEKLLHGEVGFRNYLSEGCLRRLAEYETFYSKQLAEGKVVELPVVDLSQNVSVRATLSTMLPSLLTGSCVWSMKHNRPLTTLELFFAMGWPAPVVLDNDNFHAEFPFLQT
ncbi:unnamed protein product [Symbiodinium necroappetens]|uniref:Uncharacterized protein n=1 Tax=Symbiodinium necroappetens TaxID=1628268 RepID=A0A812V785_9DINO|nr:unnamed protein product [Symbiodinium necroappetens]